MIDAQRLKRWVRRDQKTNRVGLRGEGALHREQQGEGEPRQGDGEAHAG
jgi:hypothetical protein